MGGVGVCVVLFWAPLRFLAARPTRPPSTLTAECDEAGWGWWGRQRWRVVLFFSGSCRRPREALPPFCFSSVGRFRLWPDYVRSQAQGELHKQDGWRVCAATRPRS